jgi:hypothetical protein
MVMTKPRFMPSFVKSSMSGLRNSSEMAKLCLNPRLGKTWQKELLNFCHRSTALINSGSATRFPTNPPTMVRLTSVPK